MSTMSDHPDAPTLILDIVMMSHGAAALRHMLGERLSEKDLRTDLSDIVAVVVNLMQPPRYDGPERRARVVDLRVLDDRSGSTAH